MKDHHLIKKILQEQEVKITTIDFTQKVMHRIALQEERKKRICQTIFFFIIFGFIAWMYIAIKPYFKEFLQPIVEVWKMQSFNEYLSLPYLICYAIVLLAIGYLLYDEQSHSFKQG